MKINTAEIRLDDEKDKLIVESKDDPRIKLLGDIISELSVNNNGKMKVLLLVRNNYDLGIIQLWVQNKNLGINVIKNDNNSLAFQKENIIITCMTIHKSKGLEADNVILFDIREGFRGLPDTLGDDNILRFVIASKENIDFAEDRRLFYVALTRTKNRVYIICRTREHSRFLDELEKDNEFDVDSNSGAFRCPLCGGFLVQIPNKGFYGCGNYYQNNCEFKIKAKNDNELELIYKNKNKLKRAGILGCYLPCVIKKMELVKSSLGSAAIRITYSYKVGETEVSNFVTYLNKNYGKDKKNALKLKSFINSLRNNDKLDPFDDFEKFKEKYIGKINNVLVFLNKEGKLESVSATSSSFRRFEG